MDFSSYNPATTNALNLAARANDTKAVRRLLKKINPNCIDNRGWTCLHEAADNDSYESLCLILKHTDCRPLAETHEGHTALYLACRNNASIKTIKALLDSVDDIANYGSTEGVTPLHVASSQGRVELITLLLEYGAMIDVQDFDGDTPLHDAALETQHESVIALLHAGADPEIKNDPGGFTAFHLACYKGSYETVQQFLPFITDINNLTVSGDSCLILALQGFNDEIMKLLLKNGADPHIRNSFGQTALDVALCIGYVAGFSLLLCVTDKNQISIDTILRACKPHYFKLEIMEALLYSDLGPAFFDASETFHTVLEKLGDYRPCYLTNAALNSYLHVCEYIYEQVPEKFREYFYLYLMRGVSVNALDITECPPLVYIHYCMHRNCFHEVFQILLENKCDVDYCSSLPSLNKHYIPDAFIGSLSSDPSTSLVMLPYSLHCDPDQLLRFANTSNVLDRMPVNVQKQLMLMVDDKYEGTVMNFLYNCVLPLKHLCRLKIRRTLRRQGVNTTEQYLDVIQQLPLPKIMINYLRYI